MLSKTLAKSVMLIPIIYGCGQGHSGLSRAQLMNLSLVPLKVYVNKSGRLPESSKDLTEIPHTNWSDKLIAAVDNGEFTYAYKPTKDASEYEISIHDSKSGENIMITDFLGKSRQSWTVLDEFVKPDDKNTIPDFWNEVTWVITFAILDHKENQMWELTPFIPLSDWCKKNARVFRSVVKQTDWNGAVISVQRGKKYFAIVKNAKGEETRFPLTYSELPNIIK